MRAFPDHSLNRFHFSCPNLMAVHLWVFFKETRSPSSVIKKTDKEYPVRSFASNA